MDGNLGELLLQACGRWGGKIAVEDGEQGLSFSRLDELSSAVARSLKDRRLGKDEPVIALVSNKAMDWVSVLGLWRAGGVLVPVHRTTPGPAFQELLARTGARFVLDAAGKFEPLGTAHAEKGATLRVLGGAAPPPRSILESAAFIVFTSGSTGRPKGTVISHGSFAAKLRTLEDILCLSPDTRSLLVLQMTFSFGMWVSLLTLISGGTLVMREKFQPLPILRTLSERQITTAALVPTMLRALFGSSEPEVADALRELVAQGRLRQVILGGETLDALVDDRLRERFPKAQVFDVYGTTETATSDFILRPSDDPSLRGTIGRASPGVQYRVIDEHGRDARPGDMGELRIRSAFVMNGYLDEPDLTRQSFADGYFRTGDVVRVREDGGLQMVGRSKEIISRGANKVSPLEVEAALLSHPAVSEAIVTGVPDPMMGERIHGLVVPVDGARPTVQELKAWVGSRLDKFKVPDTIHFGTDIPRGRTGKADRAQLRRSLVDASALRGERRE